ncbi:uncharacterized protein LOC134845264 [Symsagittifera roscoffensis]|uniref:uncharacterized protein LOC134845264 n=1 Tax=Symsagittifera roscoffensis TaxID=84072 RepID=UPI00307CC6C1
MTHSAHGYLSAVGRSREETAKSALETIGMPLFNAAVSSVLGVCLLAAAETYAMQSFFLTMTILMVLSFFYGVVALPVIFSILGSRWDPINWASEDRTFSWRTIFKTQLYPAKRFSHDNKQNAVLFGRTSSSYATTRDHVSSGKSTETSENQRNSTPTGSKKSKIASGNSQQTSSGQKNSQQRSVKQSENTEIIVKSPE